MSWGLWDPEFLPLACPQTPYSSMIHIGAAQEQLGNLSTKWCVLVQCSALCVEVGLVGLLLRPHIVQSIIWTVVFWDDSGPGHCKANVAFPIVLTEETSNSSISPFQGITKRYTDLVWWRQVFPMEYSIEGWRWSEGRANQPPMPPRQYKGLRASLGYPSLSF